MRLGAKIPPPPPQTPSDPAPRLDPHEKMRIRSAAFRATRLYPGPVGELISKELLDWEEFGYRFDTKGAAARLVDHVLKAPLPARAEQVQPPGYRAAI
jgi:hypothetical protein